MILPIPKLEHEITANGCLRCICYHGFYFKVQINIFQQLRDSKIVQKQYMPERVNSAKINS
jgi:hypothetical protein